MMENRRWVVMDRAKLEGYHSLEELLNDQSEPPPDIIGNGFLQPKTLLLVAGKPKARKSMLVFNMGLALAAGRGFAIFPVKKPHRVLLLSAEGGYYPNRERLKKMCQSFKVDKPENFTIFTIARWKLEDKQSYKHLYGVVRELKPEVLIIDPFVRFHNLEENSANQMAFVIGKIRAMIEDLNLSVILVHHVGKSENAGARGSSAIPGECDACIHIHKGNVEQELEFEMRFVEPLEKTTLTFNSETLWFEGGAKASELAPLLQKAGPLAKKDLLEAI